jgi:hypothetical protein
MKMECLNPWRKLISRREKVRIRIGGIVRKTKGVIAGSKIEEIIEEIESEGIL